MLNEEHIETCKYIEREMRYITYEDFVENAWGIKRLYTGLKHKGLYMWYVYSRMMSDRRKDLIWEYLNGDKEYSDLKGYKFDK